MSRTERYEHYSYKNEIEEREMEADASQLSAERRKEKRWQLAAVRQKRQTQISRLWYLVPQH